MTFKNFFYLNSESGAAVLHETVELVESQPVVIVACRYSKPVAIFRPVVVERFRRSGALPLHQNPTVDSQYRQSDSRVDAQGSDGCLFVRCFKICTVISVQVFQFQFQRKKQRKKETNKQTKKQRNKERKKERKKERNKETKKERNKQTNKETKKETNKETNKETTNETNKQTNNETKID